MAPSAATSTLAEPVPLAVGHRRDWLAARLFTAALYGSCVIFFAIVGGLFLELLWGSRLSLERFGLGFLWSSHWNPVTHRFGALPFIYGTVVSSGIALVLAAGVGIMAGVYLAEFAPRRLASTLSLLIELLAAVPSVVYGLWGLFVLAPIVSSWIGPALQGALGFLPIFQGTIYGVNMLTASLILALMIVPTITAITRDLVAAVPRRTTEASLALGATRWETTYQVILPILRPGIFGACMLALGRALGETIATTMVIGNRPAISVSLFAPGYTVASVIANEFTEATTNLYLSALIELGLILFVVSVIINGAGRLLLQYLVRSR
jgi:phosphate transport system permease protein